MASFTSATSVRAGYIAHSVASAAPQTPFRRSASSSAKLANIQTARLSMGVKTRRAVLCQADSTEEEKATTPTPPPAKAAEDAPAEGPVKGQGTAIATGVVAIILGVLYLYAASILDSRELLPPPPEALGL
mmetsp:Transcript_19970/g.33547  ORF Transcript_19970/g.33547 Transcript_19970/m.33547 type:complete len:131 (-) Transcript_19970:293-685(-)|eukprot:CAMPEP_0198209448 /NCGR_PEP_ID=MMETSP1445-20131203/15906_1 /TAXON_ID=36898 /ORGANISM="Pyramimonas sp., Strain CCMP2087" /LENGTH=130 /DNA_ID=CAMNT_0043883223 /DNA_START=126 /DNA_END=518 /DNA_ORIENTATION=+